MKTTTILLAAALLAGCAGMPESHQLLPGQPAIDREVREPVGYSPDAKWKVTARGGFQSRDGTLPCPTGNCITDGRSWEQEKAEDDEEE